MGNSLKSFKQQPSSVAYQPLINPPISVEAQNENLRVFSFAELKKATKKFRQERVVECEDGSVRTFYKCYIDDTTFAPSRTKTGTPVSVVECLKKSSHDLQEWMEEVKSLGKFSHPNLVKFFGYCYCEDKKSLFLVFEYLHKGSLDRHIFGKEEEALPWEIRVKIAIGTAQGHAFLHSIKNTPLHQELRMYNILLDEQYNAKLFYLESYKYLEHQNAVARESGYYYIAPEYVMSGRSVMETDVYILGVILLELLIGSECRNKFKSKHSLDVLIRSFSLATYKIGDIMDPRLGSNYPVNAAEQMGKLIQSCTNQNKGKRPLMQQVLDVLNDIAEIKY